MNSRLLREIAEELFAMFCLGVSGAVLGLVIGLAVRWNQ